MKGRPDVIEKLNFDDRFQSTSGETNCPADDVRFRERRVVNAGAAKLALQIRGDFEDTALAFYFVQRVFARAIRHILAKDDDTRISLHFSVQAAIDEIDHRASSVAQAGGVFGIERF